MDTAKFYITSHIQICIAHYDINSKQILASFNVHPHRPCTVYLTHGSLQTFQLITQYSKGRHKPHSTLFSKQTKVSTLKMDYIILQRIEKDTLQIPLLSLTLVIMVHYLLSTHTLHYIFPFTPTAILYCFKGLFQSKKFIYTVVWKTEVYSDH